jgi:hypothetical protein
MRASKILDSSDSVSQSLVLLIEFLQTILASPSTEEILDDKCNIEFVPSLLSAPILKIIVVNVT